MYIKNSLICLSFHAKKTLPIGRGGAILTDSKKAYEWFKCARFDGRHEVALDNDTLAFPGWNMYMTPEQAARGLELMQWIKDENIGSVDPYQDLSKYEFYKTSGGLRAAPGKNLCDTCKHKKKCEVKNIHFGKMVEFCLDYKKEEL
jgi:hypothetical protein